jgi:progranulin
MLGAGEAGKLTFESFGQASEVIVCPNGISKCSVDHTCCKIGNEWGCCPFPRATCCSDNVHCCPQSYSCDILKQQCVQGVNNETTPWAKKLPAPVSSSEAAAPPENLICPDGTSCLGASACCRTLSGRYSCCNYPNNVCCADGNHCCPRCSICDSRAFTCIPSYPAAKWGTVVPTKSAATIPSDAADEN